MQYERSFHQSSKYVQNVAEPKEPWSLWCVRHEYSTDGEYVCVILVETSNSLTGSNLN